MSLCMVRRHKRAAAGGNPRWRSLAAVLALLAGEAGAQLYATPITMATTTYELAGYSVDAPRGGDWFELKRDRNEVLFGKRIASRTHAFIATAIAAPVAETFERPEQFRDFIGKTPLEPEDQRSRVLESRVELDDSLGVYCVRLYIKSLDRDAVYARGDPLVIETFGVSCLHPADPSLAVSVSYSERATAEESSTVLRAEGETFVRSLKFTALSP